MDFKTKTSLWHNQTKVAEQGDKLKIHLKNDEVFIGEYDFSDIDTITILRNGEEWNFDLDDVDDIEVL